MIAWIRRNWWWFAGAILAAYKLSLLRSQHIFAISNAHHDDGLFMKLATHVVRGEWFGPYDQLTLSKGPAYPLFIAVNFWAGLPLALTQQLLYVAGCVAVVWALKPVIQAGWARFLAFSFLVYNPLTYEGETMTRLLRQHLTVPLALLVIAGVIALCLRRDAGRPIRGFWALATGAALGVFQLTREEGIWIAPMLLLSGAALTAVTWREGKIKRIETGGLAVLILVASAVPGWWISAQNRAHYGWSGTVDFKAESFADAVGALSRVKIGPDWGYVQSNPEARAAIYPHSPAFDELRPHLESGPIADKWMETEKHPTDARFYMTGWFHWALRDAIAAAGHATNPQAFIDFSERLAAEVNAACDDGRLESVGPRSGFLPRWHEDYGVAMRAEWRRYLGEAMNLTRFETIVPGSTGSDDEIRPFVDLSYDNLSPAPRATYFHKPDQIELNRLKIDRLRSISNGLRGKFEVLFWVAFGLLVVRVVEATVRRTWSWSTWLAVAVLATALAELVINFLVHTMAFENLSPAAFAPAYPLLQIMTILVFADVAKAWIQPGFKLLWTRFKPLANQAA